MPSAFGASTAITAPTTRLPSVSKTLTSPACRARSRINCLTRSKVHGGSIPGTPLNTEQYSSTTSSSRTTSAPEPSSTSRCLQRPLEPSRTRSPLPDTPHTGSADDASEWPIGQGTETAALTLCYPIDRASPDPERKACLNLSVG